MFLFSCTFNGRRMFPEDRHFNLPTFPIGIVRAVWWPFKYGTGLKSYSKSISALYLFCLVPLALLNS